MRMGWGEIPGLFFHEEKKMKVKVKKLGYFNHERRKEGDILEIKEEQFSPRWMEKLDNRKKKDALEEQEVA